MIDGLNKVYNTSKDIYELIRDYFRAMEELDEEQEEERVDLSMEIYEIWKNIEKLLEIMQEYSSIDQQFLVNKLVEEYSGVVSKYVEVDMYLEEHIKEVCELHIAPDLTKDEEEWAKVFATSTLISLATDGAQDALNYKDFMEAKKQGKKSKTWIAFHDKLTRRDHAKLDGKTIPINNHFLVGDVMMRFPRDWQYAGNSVRALRQIISCRCQIKYNN